MTRLIRLLPALAALALSGCYLFKKSETFYGLDTAGQKIAFVIDVSGSMEGKSEGSLEDRVTGQAVQSGGDALGGAIGGKVGALVGKQASAEATKLGAAKRELIPAIQGLPESSSFVVITFGNKVEPWVLGMTSASGTNKATATALIKDLSASGGTPAKEALDKAFGYADVNVIFFVSDGQPTDAGANDILAHVRSLNATRQLKVQTVGLGKDQDEQFLRALATENGGQYVKK
jgi:uncharacterized protein YegL